MPEASVNGIQLHYEIHGEGDPVMLITGLGGSGTGWAPQAQLFGKDYLTVVPDHRGAGQSTFAEDGYTIEQHASDMAETLRKINCGPAHIIGSSTGGAIATVMALDEPDVVRSIVVCSSWAKTDSYFRHQFETRKLTLVDSGIRAAQEANALFLFAPTYLRDHYDKVEEWIEMISSIPADVAIMVKRIDMIIAHDQLNRLPDIQIPCLVIVGEEDFCTPPYLSRELASVIPGAELAIMEGGHFFYKERPMEFYGRVREFLESQ